VHAKDRLCLAPEQAAALAPGDECASVWAVGVMLYEMVTGRSVGIGMKTPREVDPSLPVVLEFILGNSIIQDRSRRPSDLSALATALLEMTPQLGGLASVPVAPPSEPAAFDVRFSIIPTEPPLIPAHEGPEVRISVVPPIAAQPLPASISTRAIKAQPPDGNSRMAVVNSTVRLSALKERLESDPRPRYVVSKDWMDHGPFNAVELLQQIASHSFLGSHLLRDDIEGVQRPIEAWDDFAPFARQAELMRDKKAEEHAVVRAAHADKKRGIAQLVVAGTVVVAVAGVLAIWFLSRRGTHSEAVVIENDHTDAIEVNGDIKGAKHRPHGGGAGGGGGGYSGGASYESILNGSGDSVVMGRSTGNVPDLTNGQLAAPLRYASFLGSCGAPGDMKVTVRVAVRSGRAVGVTTTTNPANSAVAGCIDRVVRNLSWPQNAKTDFITVNY
jgi:hypothetical protein